MFLGRLRTGYIVGYRSPSDIVWPKPLASWHLVAAWSGPRPGVGGRSLATQIDILQRPYAYYEILGIPRSSRMSDVKAAYLRLAKRYHPDMVGAVDETTKSELRSKFDEITEAYTTLIDVTQRHFYDQHGFSCDGLRRKGMPSVFDYRPRFSLYEDGIKADGDSCAVEDWFKAQGHSWEEPKTTWRQKLKNAYVEYRWGLLVYNFPWDFPGFGRSFVILVALLVVGSVCFQSLMRSRIDSLYDGHPHKPIPFNDAWKNDEIRDILHHFGIRKKYPSAQSVGGLYQSSGEDPLPRKESEYEHTLYSNTRRGAFSQNKERHQARERQKEEDKTRRLENLLDEESALIERQAVIAAKIQQMKDDRQTP
eukprot:maker-scaffold774_size99688-snap-gene-0.19 protein:Tk10082 transcript:maker-scaffold774_size99688-snap-gene-0.19-mRNA-1 annotation:"molecular chaperone"